MRKFVIPASLAGTARPPGGTPDHARQAKSKLALLGAGGKRVSINLPAKAVKDLEKIKVRDGSDNTDAIIVALHRHAGR